MGTKLNRGIGFVAIVGAMAFVCRRNPGVDRKPSAEKSAERATVAPLSSPAPVSPESTPADRAPESAALTPDQQRAAMLDFKAKRIIAGQKMRAQLGAARGSPVAGTPYWLMSGLNSVKADLAPSDALKKIGPWAIVNNPSGLRSPDDRLTNFNPNDLAVVTDTSAKLGLATGVLNLTMTDPSLAPQVANDYGLDVAQVFGDTHLVFLKARLGSNLGAALLGLQKDPRVSGAELDVWSAAATPR